MLLLIDNYDSFTYNLVDYFHQLGEPCKVIKNTTPLEEVKNLHFKGIVISPGPQKPKDANFLLDYIDYYHDKKPILGVCLGHQAIAEFLGGTLTLAKRPMHGKVSSIRSNGEDLFATLPEEYNVVRYHSWVVDQWEQLPIIPLAFSKNEKELMAFRHKSFPLWGIQFHPESILTEYGIKLLKNWLLNFY